MFRLPSLTTPAAVVAAAAGVPVAPLGTPTPAAGGPDVNKKQPLAQRLTVNPTIAAKANYYDLAQTRRPPHDLRTALIWLCLCAHDNSVWWEPRTPDHEDGEDAPPLPLALNYSAWSAYIAQWGNDNFSFDEEAAVQAFALRVWLGAHKTAVVPDEDDSQKKTASEASLTGQSSTPGSSQAETPPAATRPSSASTLAPRTRSSTPGSRRKASRPSRPKKSRAATKKSTRSSPRR